MEKIDISQSVKTLEFGSKYEARIQRIFREFDIKTIRDLCQWPGKDLVRVRDMGRKSIEEIGRRGNSPWMPPHLTQIS